MRRHSVLTLMTRLFMDITMEWRALPPADRGLYACSGEPLHLDPCPDLADMAMLTRLGDRPCAVQYLCTAHAENLHDAAVRYRDHRGW